MIRHSEALFASLWEEEVVEDWGKPPALGDSILSTKEKV